MKVRENELRKVTVEFHCRALIGLVQTYFSFFFFFLMGLQTCSTELITAEVNWDLSRDGGFEGLLKQSRGGLRGEGACHQEEEGHACETSGLKIVK